MELVRVTAPDFPMQAEAFALYESSFPVHEQRPPDSQRAILSHPDYHYGLLLEDGGFAGLLLYWETESFCYVEHFCTLPALRGRGLGAQALGALAAEGRTVILEIDPPVDEISVRRKGFYERAGFCANPRPHIHPPYRPETPGHPLVVMSSPAPLSGAEYAAFSGYLGGTVMRGLPRAENGNA